MGVSRVTIFFRADANEKIASGHIMRCISISKKFKNAGYETIFLVADKNPIEILEENNQKYIVLESDWKKLSIEIEKVINIFRQYQNSIYIIDTYSINKEYVMALKPYCKICYLGSKKAYLGELSTLINYSTDIDYEFYKKNYPTTKLLLGPSFSPLREEFSNVQYKNREKIERVLITTGNTNQDKIVEGIISAILYHAIEKKYKIAIVIGTMFHDKKSLYDLARSSSEIEIYENIKNISQLMISSDLAISACGTTVYELAAVGLPIISFAMSEEQVKSAESLSDLGITAYCGRSYENKSDCIALIKRYVQVYCDNPNKRNILSQKAKKLIDGAGCQRIVEEIVKC